MLLGTIQEGNTQADSKPPRRDPALVEEMGRLRVEMERDHPTMLIQHSRVIL